MEKGRNTIQDYDDVPIIGISRHRMGMDGNGVTTLVAFHGCNLSCIYCLNPEALGSDEGIPRYTPEALYDIVKVDDLYFRATGGGVTFGGGEPCLKADFIVSFSKLCGSDWKIRVETSLNAPLEDIEKLLPVVDEWIVDIKTDDEGVYEEYTGQPFSIAHKTLRWLIERIGYNSDKLILRIPVIPGFTDSEMVQETKRQFELTGIYRFDLLTYRTERPTRVRPMIEGLEPGKAKCKLLKEIRKDLAYRYSIRYRERDCEHEGDCPGTCPLCEADLESLTRQIKVVSPDKLELSKEVVDLCRLNNSFSSDSIPGKSIPESDDCKTEGEHPLAGDVILPPDPPTLKYKRVFFKECPVAGLSFHIEKDDELWDELCEGTKIALVRDRNNKYDRNAVAVALADDYDGDADHFDFDFILGYVPRTENTEIAAMMDAGYSDKFEAEITTYHRYGSYNDRIRITIWLLSNEPKEVRPDRLRFHSLDFGECMDLIDELRRRGTAHFRWGFFNERPLNLPDVGEKVVIACSQSGKSVLFLMKVIAKGDDCAPFLDNPEETEYIDDCETFVLTNITGPVTVDTTRLNFPGPESLDKRQVYDWLNKYEDRTMRDIFNNELKKWWPGNIDMDPSIDDPK